MKRIAFFGVACSSLFFTACGDDSNFPTNDCGDATSAHCVEVRGGDTEALLVAANSAEADTTIILGKGRFELDRAVQIRQAGVSLIGQGIDDTTLSYGTATTQVNGVDVIGNDFLVQDLTVLDATLDGIRVESSIGVTFRRIRATWTEPYLTTNGKYGIYPVKSQNVLVEDSFAENASDAGLYVGQCQHVIVRNNTVRFNVAGLEIENTAYADVYGNLAEDNTGGILVFDMQENPIIGRDVRLFDNVIRNNNTENFAAAGTTVHLIPAGTGTFVLASRRVEITDNTFENNGTTDVAILSGLVLDPSPSSWVHATSSLIGDWQDLGLIPAGPDAVTNFRTENVVIAGNTFSGSGQMIDTGDPKHLGLMLSVAFAGHSVSNVLYDSIGETTFDAANLAANTNDNRVCVGGNQAASFASIHLEVQEAANGASPIVRLDAGPFGPFDCTTLNGAPITPVVLASAGD